MRFFQVIIGGLGRLCLSLVFLWTGVTKLLEWGSSREELLAAIDSVTASGVTMSPAMLNIFAFMEAYPAVIIGLGALLEILGAIMILLGYKPRLGSTLLLFFLIPATFVMHHFWLVDKMADPDLYQIELMMFLKNVAIIGGLLIVLAFGTGMVKVKKAKKEEKPTPKSNPS